MKSLIFAVGIFAAVAGRAEEPRFLSLSSDASEYALQSRAVVFFDAKYRPAGEEFVFKSKLNGLSLNVIQLTDSMAVALTPELSEVGGQTVEGLLYQQKASTATAFEKTISYFHYENVHLRVRLRQEVEEAKRQKILSQIAANENRMKAAEDALEQSRKFVQIQHLSLQVNGEQAFIYPDAFLLQADRNPAVYSVGESAAFYAHLNTLFDGSDGEKEPVFKAMLGSLEVPTRKIDSKNFSFSTKPFVAGSIGANELQVTLKARSLARANRLGNAKDQAMAKRDEFVSAMGKAKNLEDKRYFQLKAEHLNTAIQALAGQLEAIALPVDVKTLSFSVSE